MIKLSLYLTLTAGTDYVPVSPVYIFFNSSITVQCLLVEVINDTILELNETFSVNLEVSDTDVILENQTVTIIIEDDDCK